MPADAPIHFHEDLYCQIQLLPRSAWTYCADQLGIIEEFAKVHREGDGYTDIYVRRDGPARLAELCLRADDLDRLLSAWLPRHRSVTTGYSTHVEPVLRMVGYGPRQSCCLFVEGDETGLVKQVFLLLAGLQPRELDQMHAALRDLAQTADLLLVDWEDGRLLALGDGAAVRDYLASALAVGSP
jgi:hypothetical protein